MQRNSCNQILDAKAGFSRGSLQPIRLDELGLRARTGALIAQEECNMTEVVKTAEAPEATAADGNGNGTAAAEAPPVQETPPPDVEGGRPPWDDAEPVDIGHIASIKEWRALADDCQVLNQVVTKPTNHNVGEHGKNLPHFAHEVIKRLAELAAKHSMVRQMFASWPKRWLGDPGLAALDEMLTEELAPVLHFYGHFTRDTAEMAAEATHFCTGVELLLDRETNRNWVRAWKLLDEGNASLRDDVIELQKRLRQAGFRPASEQPHVDDTPPGRRILEYVRDVYGEEDGRTATPDDFISSITEDGMLRAGFKALLRDSGFRAMTGIDHLAHDQLEDLLGQIAGPEGEAGALADRRAEEKAVRMRDQIRQFPLALERLRGLRQSLAESTLPMLSEIAAEDQPAAAEDAPRTQELIDELDREPRPPSLATIANGITWSELDDACRVAATAFHELEAGKLPSPEPVLHGCARQIIAVIHKLGRLDENIFRALTHAVPDILPPQTEDAPCEEIAGEPEVCGTGITLPLNFLNQITEPEEATLRDGFRAMLQDPEFIEVSSLADAPSPHIVQAFEWLTVEPRRVEWAREFGILTGKLKVLQQILGDNVRHSLYELEERERATG